LKSERISFFSFDSKFFNNYPLQRLQEEVDIMPVEVAEDIKMADPMGIVIIKIILDTIIINSRSSNNKSPRPQWLSKD
jgi:hypothetical protein